MMNLIPKTNIDFLKHRKLLFIVSFVLIVLSITVIAVRGLNLGIDFRGGTMVQVAFSEPTTIDQVRKAVEKFNPEIQSFVGKNTYSIKIKGVQEDVNTVTEEVQNALNSASLKYTVESTDFVGPTVGKELATNAVKALVFSLIFMVLYIAFRFQNIVWGSAGVMALAHDAILMVGFFAMLQKEFDLIIVAALLTAVGYSINDNIVIFDRMRENIRENPKEDMYSIINRSVNETLSRTIITSLTLLFAVIVLYFLGGDVLKNFSLIMIFGVIVGTYSTIFVATPLVYQWVKDAKDTSHLVSDAKAENQRVATEVKKHNKKKHHGHR